MKMIRRLPKFHYCAPNTVEQACALLAEHGENAAVMAGGTNLLPKMKRRERVPEYLISLTNIPNLDRIKHSASEGLRLGPRVTIHDIQTSPIIREKFPALAQASENLASAQVRNLATVAGNLCNTAPCADMPPALLASGARLKLINSTGERTLSVDQFYAAPFKSTMKADELLVEITVPNPADHSTGVYLKHTFRGAMEYPLVGIAAILAVQGRVCTDATITGSFCSHCWRREGCKFPCPSPFQATSAEEMLRGKTLDDALIQEAAVMAARDAKPIVNKDYTREMVTVYTKRAITKAWNDAKKN
jgi:aerobic carbon-monoxide dehydrogenase medium subunit